MRLSIVVYDEDTVKNIKENTFRFFSKQKDLIQNIIWQESINIEFQGRLIIINWNKNFDDIIKKYMDTILKGKEVTINSMSHMEYYEAFGNSQKLIVQYSK